MDKVPIFRHQRYRKETIICKNVFEKSALKIVTRQHLQQLGDFIRNLQKLVVGRGDPVNQLVYAASTLDGLQKLRDFWLKNTNRTPKNCLV